MIWKVACKACLQQQLAKYMIAPGIVQSNMTCSSISQFAFESHPYCYTQPAPGVSICYIHQDWYNIVVNVVGIDELFAPESIPQVVETLYICAKQWGYERFLHIPLQTKDSLEVIKVLADRAKQDGHAVEQVVPLRIENGELLAIVLPEFGTLV